MELLQNLLTRFRRTAVLLLVGIILITYISFGVVYLQQQTQQATYVKEIARLTAVLARPPASVEELKAEYDNVTKALVPISERAAFDIIVGIAKESGIDTTQEYGKFTIPPAVIGKVKVGDSAYETLTFNSIHVQGEYDKVLAFLTDLDTGQTLPNMVLKSVRTFDEEITFSGEEGEKRAEFRAVQDAVLKMMEDNRLQTIPNPINRARGTATNYMGDDNTTQLVIEGFPDITITAAEKGFTGENTTPKGGYVLYRHDRINTDNTTLFTTMNYYPTLKTKYYYTCESNGLVRQFDGPVVVLAKEQIGMDAKTLETIATVTVDIYTKPRT
ncbi:MAG: hypothetical protein ABIH70_08095 [Chloroflexota bacterium]